MIEIVYNASICSYKKNIYKTKDDFFKEMKTWPYELDTLMSIKFSRKDYVWLIDNFRNIPYITNAKSGIWVGDMAKTIMAQLLL